MQGKKIKMFNEQTCCISINYMLFVASFFWLLKDATNDAHVFCDFMNILATS